VIVVDTTVLSNLARVQRLNLLGELFGEILIPLPAYEEILRGLEAHYTFLQAVEELLEEDWVTLGSLEPKERKLFTELLQRVDPGEAAGIAIAKRRKLLFFSDDRVARRTALDQKVSILRMGAWGACCVGSHLGGAEARRRGGEALPRGGGSDPAGDDHCRLSQPDPVDSGAMGGTSRASSRLAFGGFPLPFYPTSQRLGDGCQDLPHLLDGGGTFRPLSEISPQLAAPQPPVFHVGPLRRRTRHKGLLSSTEKLTRSPLGALVFSFSAKPLQCFQWLHHLDPNPPGKVASVPTHD
jgi:predicted nucleic acid-binding protein